MWRSLRFVLAVLSALAPSVAQADPAQKRLALVIANSDYDHDGRNITPPESSSARGFLTDLVNTRNDGVAVARALSDLRFDVTIIADADRQSLMTALAIFGARVAGAAPDSIIVIYYSGHAIQVNGTNFILPSEARIPRDRTLGLLPPQQSETIIRGYAIPLNDVFAQLRSPAPGGLNLIILDSCRDNPWESRINGTYRSVASRSLAEQAPRLTRTLVAYSTAPGDVASDGDTASGNSPYTHALLRWVRRPELTVLQMLNYVGRDVLEATGQVPWMNNAPLEDICLAGCTHSRVDHRVAAGSTTTDGIDIASLNAARAALASFSPIDWITLPWSIRQDRMLSAASVATYRALAEAGNPRAMFFLGVYLSQRGAPSAQTDDGLRWIRRAADANEPYAQSQVGYMYQAGRFLPQDQLQAFTWFLRAANQGDRYSQNRVGTYYAEGRGRPVDLREAAFWFRQAAAQGEPVAQFNLGRLLVAGEGVAPNREEGLALIRSAAAAGLPDAQTWLRDLGSTNPSRN